jgi:hypothetical protein
VNDLVGEFEDMFGRARFGSDEGTAKGNHGFGGELISTMRGGQDQPGGDDRAAAHTDRLISPWHPEGDHRVETGLFRPVVQRWGRR